MNLGQDSQFVKWREAAHGYRHFQLFEIDNPRRDGFKMLFKQVLF